MHGMVNSCAVPNDVYLYVVHTSSFSKSIPGKEHKPYKPYKGLTIAN